jgi:hypothetical protein
MKSWFDRGVVLYKESLELCDPAPLHELFQTVPAADRAGLVASFLEFLKAERGRLVKIKSLGQSHRFEERVKLTDDLIARLRETT